MATAQSIVFWKTNWLWIFNLYRREL